MLLAVPLQVSTTLRFAGLIPVQSSGSSIFSFILFFVMSAQELLRKCRLFDLTKLEVATLASC